MKRLLERWLDRHPELPLRLGLLVWTVLLGAFGWDAWTDARRATREFALAKARAVLRTERAYHRWVTELGGVYVPVSDRNPPIERLKDLTDRDAKSAGGLDLTLINPGCLIWSDVRPDDTETGVRSHAIRFDPNHPENLPDPWESEALRALATGKQEVQDFTGANGNRVFRFMAGIHTEPSCLACHADQGFEVGDLRGGIRIDVPLNAPEFLAGDHDQHSYAAGLAVAWMAGVGVIQGGGRFARRRRREREESLAKSQQAERLARLQRDLGLALSSSHDFDSMLRLGLQTAIEASNMDCGGLYLADSATGDLKMVTHIGLSPEFVALVTHCPADSPKTKLVNQGTSLFAQYADIAGPDGQAQLREGLKAIAVIPMHHESQVIGCLNVASHILASVPEDARPHLEVLAPQIASVIARVKAEQALRRHQALLEAIYEHTPFMLCLLNERGEIERMNRSMASLVARPDEAGALASPCQALGCTHEASPAAVAAVATDATGCQACALRRLISETPMSGQGRQHRELTVSRLHKGQVQELRFAASTAVVPVADRTRILLCLEDITAKKHLETQFFQAQKMEAIGQLAGGVAHDFNNILGASMLNLELLLASPHLRPEMKADLEELEKGSRRAAALTRQLLLFGRRETAQIRRVNLVEILKGLLKMIRRLLGEHIDITLDTPASSPWIEADPGMIEQVVVNLCVNARDAMPKGGPLRLQVTNVDVTPEIARLSPEARVGSFLCLRVEDSGTGIDPETLTHIFEPFFTTKAAGKGTGLGLATVYGIVRQHQGWVEVESRVGLGTTFTLHLPAAESPTATTPTAPDQRALPKGQETILLVEDDDSLLRPVSRMLGAGGYRVIQARNGAEALQAWEGAKHQIQLLLTDMVMPGGISGLDLAETLRRSQPSLKVIIASGYSPELPQTAGVLRDGITFLPKPYDPSTLARTLRECLDAP